MINQASQVFNSSLEMDHVLRTVLEEVRSFTNAAGSTIWLTDYETGGLVCREATGNHSEIVRGWRLAPGEGLAGWVASHGESLVVSDTSKDTRHFKGVDRLTGLDLRSIVCVPLQTKGEVIGILQVVDSEPGFLGTKYLKMLETLGSCAANSIENARLYKQAKHELAERKLAEETLQASETRFRSLIEKNADGIVIVDNDGRIVFVNPAAEALFQCTADEFVGEAFKFPVVIGKIAEVDIVYKGGEIAIVQMRSTEIEWEGEKAYLTSIRDVTEISRARKKIDLLANLVENDSYVMIFIVNHDGQIIECNALAGNTFGYSKSAMLTIKLGALFKYKEEKRWEKIAETVQQASHWRENS